MTTAPRDRRPHPWLVLGGLLVVAVLIRLAALPGTGHSGDVSVISRWASFMREGRSS